MLLKQKNWLIGPNDKHDFLFPQDTGVNEVLRRVKSGKFHIPSSVSVDARSLIGLLLQADPRNRVSAQEILKHSFMISAPQTVSTIILNNQSSSYELLFKH